MIFLHVKKKFQKVKKGVTFCPEQISCVNWHHLILPKFVQFLLFLSKSVNHNRYTNENSRNWDLWKLYQSIRPSRIFSIGGFGQWNHLFHFFSVKTKSRSNWYVCVWYITWVLFHIVLTQRLVIFFYDSISITIWFWAILERKNPFFSRQIDCILILYIYVVHNIWYSEILELFFLKMEGGVSKFTFNFVLHAWSSYIEFNFFSFQ